MQRNRLLKKARHILRTHGVRGLIQRGTRHLRRTQIARAERHTQRLAWDRLLEHIGDSGPVFFPRHEAPLVSVIIPVHGKVNLTAACLHALLRTLDSIPCEVIVIDDASTDNTANYLESCSGLRAIRHVTNQGFVQSVNDGAAAARGRYLHFLNNDTIVTPGWLAGLLRAFDSEAVAAVGSQLRAPDGSISEAGALIWHDGNGANFGRGRGPADPGVSFPREVDYCSGASLMVRSDVFRKIGGFSLDFAPAYYEDVDLCFRLREAGYKVLYTPESVVVHFEGGTAGTDTSSGVKRFQRLHREVFAAKWRVQLAKHFPPDVDLIDRAARRLMGKGTVLVMDSFIPFEDRTAGGRRLLAIMRMMRELGWHVVFISDDGEAYEPYATRVRRAGIEVVPHAGDGIAAIADLPFPVDMAWISRPDLLRKYLPSLRRRTRAKIVYDTVDLHYVRLQRQALLAGRDNGWAAMRELELDLARRSDVTVVTSEAERILLASGGIDSETVPIIEESVQTHTGYSVRHDLLFVANYTHEPNVDAAKWLATEIMPLIWSRIPTMKLTLAGADPTPAVEKLAGERVAVTGFVPDLRPLYETARLFVAPLRFGAGMKGKVVQSLAHGVPVVTTAIGAEGIGLTDGVDIMIRDDAQGFADAVLDVYNDEALWSSMSARSLQAAQRFSTGAIRPLLERVLERAFEQDVEVGVDLGFSTHSA